MAKIPQPEQNNQPSEEYIIELANYIYDLLPTTIEEDLTREEFTDKAKAAYINLKLRKFKTT